MGYQNKEMTNIITTNNKLLLLLVLKLKCLENRKPPFLRETNKTTKTKQVNFMLKETKLGM